MESSGNAGGSSSIADAPEALGLIEIRTSKGTVHCKPEEIVPKRIGLLVKQRRILLEYRVPKHGVLAHHPIAVNLNLAVDGASPCNAERIARRLRELHHAWLNGVCVEQLAEFVGRLSADGPVSKQGFGDASPRDVITAARRVPKRDRAESASPLSKASRWMKEPAKRDIFNLIKDDEQSETLSFENLYVFFADYLGFGQAEVEKWFELAAGAAGSGVTFEAFLPLFFPRLSPCHLGPGPREEVLFRKTGSLGGYNQDFKPQCGNLDTLEDCEAYLCTPTAQVFADECKRCLFLVGPVASSFFIRDCEDCIVWVACQQLRTRKCKRCTFFLWCQSDPVIESSEDLAFAPWNASFPGCAKQFEMLKFDPQRNLWNAIFDFTGKEGEQHWRILGMEELCELRVDLHEDIPWGGGREPDSPTPPVTYEMLCAEPLKMEDSGNSIANIPQSRPKLPPAPPADCKVRKLHIQDGPRPARSVGVAYFNEICKA